MAKSSAVIPITASVLKLFYARLSTGPSLFPVPVVVTSLQRP